MKRVYVYVVAMAPQNSPELVSFSSITLTDVSTEGDAYDLGSQICVLPEGFIFLNDYVHQIELEVSVV